MAEPKNTELMEKIVSLCKRRGFVFQSSEIYGGINGFWDYGPLGAELKRNVKEAWWRDIVQNREDVEGLDATIIMHPTVWKASGHVDTFTDPMVDCKTCKARFRADQMCDTPCPKKPSKKATECEGEKTEPRAFNLMFTTHVGPVKDDANVAYLRPETAQAIFVQFKNVFETSRQKPPFGIAQIGKAFRNEVTPRNFTFRSREFEQMEIEFFIKPDEAIRAISGAVSAPASGEPREDWGWEAWHKYWFESRVAWYESIGLNRDSLHIRWQEQDELAHYARATVDIEFDFPFGQQELEGIAARSDYDLSQHQKVSGKSQTIFDDELRQALSKLDEGQRAELVDSYKAARLKYLLSSGVEQELAEKSAEADGAGFLKGNYVPHVIEPSAGVDRLILALICTAYDEEKVVDEKGKEEVRTVMRFHPRIAPIKVGVFPLLKNKPELVAKAREVKKLLQDHMPVFYDEAGAIGRRYRRQDEAGTPFCLTIDFDTIGENGEETADTVTLRHRDSMKQERVRISDLVGMLLPQVR
ncbi:MAG: glycine--tRNA ligase [Verrucomicrobiae bacterium]|jgi:glycyl-tRNA synthetase|nr:glycine--tRNA ligase [Verrucomicrobiae bacterium]